MAVFLAVSAALWPTQATAHQSERFGRQIATAIVERLAYELPGYAKLIRVDKLPSRRSYVFYLRWRDPEGNVCEYGREPHIVIWRSGAVRPYDFGRWNVTCTG